MIVSFLAFGFLPVLSPGIFVILFEEFFQRFVGTPIGTRWSLAFQYNSILAPILAFGAIEAIQKKFLLRKKLATGLLLVGVLLVQILTNPALNDLPKRGSYDLTKTKDSRAILALIPASASVAATNNLGPQLTHREKIIFLTNCHDDPTVWKVDMKRCFKLKPDYLVADLDPLGDSNNLYPDGSRDLLLSYFSYLQNSGEYRLLKQQGEVYLLARNKND
ncbi:MAG: DUF2079 domain-containing protein [Patescibacteria group bacterium]